MTSTADSFNKDLEKGSSTTDGTNEGTFAGQGTTRGHSPMGKTQSVGTNFHYDKDNVYINDQAINKSDFIYAFGGSLTVTPRKATRATREFADPVPAGLAAFSCTTIALGLIQMHARGVSVASTLIGACLTTSGLVELIVGILCFIVGNTWACCTFLLFGGFWSSYAFVLMDVGGILESYDTLGHYNQSIALFFLPWALFSFILWACTWKSTWPVFTLLFFVWFFILLFVIGQFAGSVKTYKAGGFFCLMSGIVGLYNVYAGLADKSNTYFTIKPWFLPHAAKPKAEEVDQTKVE